MIPCPLELTTVVSTILYKFSLMIQTKTQPTTEVRFLIKKKGMLKELVGTIFLLITTHAEILDTEKSTAVKEVDVAAVEEKSLPPDLPIYTLETLRIYNGTNSSLPILLGLKGVVFDVTSGSKFYGRGMAYANFAGRDVTRNTAMFSTKNRDLDRVDYPPEKQDSLDSKLAAPLTFLFYVSISFAATRSWPSRWCRNLSSNLRAEVSHRRHPRQYKHGSAARHRA